MQEFEMGYREVIPDQTIPDVWKEISRNTGGTQGTLQDIKVAERANGFCYRDSSKHHTRNRFIYCRINHNILELVEHSLDLNLAGNRVRYKFVDTPILDGVSINETYDSVVVLVPTVCSIHRLVFPHPDKYHRKNELLGTHPDLAAPSIFSEARHSEALHPSTYHFFASSTTSNPQVPHLAASSLSLATDEATFVLGYPSGELLLVKQSAEGKVETVELKNETIVPRFLAGLADKLRQKDKDGETSVSLLLHTFGLETYALTLCRNGHLKFWSCSRAECVAAIDILSETGNMGRNQLQGAQNHILRKATDGYDSDCILGIFLKFSPESQMHIFQPVINGPHVRLQRVKSLSLDQNDLIDFTLSTSRIWSIWRGKEGECEVYTSMMHGDSSWVPVVLEPVPDASQPPCQESESDPRQMYLQHIFQPGRFPLAIISKALNIYKKSNIAGDFNISVANLKQQVCSAIEDEIQKEFKETVVNDEDYLESAGYCWQRFYSCCVQYHIAGLKPLGLLLLPNSSGAVLLKKSSISILRPMDSLENLTFATEFIDPELLANTLSTDSVESAEDLLNFFKVLNYLDSQMSDIFSYSFEKELAARKSPDDVMTLLVQKIHIEMDNEFSDHISRMLSECGDLYQAMHKILELLRDEYPHLDESDPDYPNQIFHIFSSQLGVSLVTGCLRQQAQIRFSICRNLLLISTILFARNELEDNVLEAIRSVCSPEIVVLTQANYLMMWLSGLSALPSLQTESTLQRLSSLKLSPVFHLRNNTNSSIWLLESFTGSTGGYEARKCFARLKQSKYDLVQWHSSLLQYLNCLFHVIWPVSGEPILAEWLLSSGQHLWLQQYVRYLSNWCDWNSCTHRFLMATSLLTSGDNHKALDLFKSASTGIFTDRFMAQRLTLNYESEVGSYVAYFLKVINLFELHKAYEGAIQLADIALSTPGLEEQFAATLHSIKFMHHLSLKNYQLAYNSLRENPDIGRRKDNLRDLVKTLLDERNLDVLSDFDYGGLEELFINIIFIRARATDPSSNIYYDFLYAFLIKRGIAFMRLAASVMYEQAFRLKQNNDVVALEKQVKCFLAAKSALMLCDPQYSYIVIPVENIEPKTIILPIQAGSEMEPDELVLKQLVDNVTLDDLKKDLLFASAKLKLLTVNQMTSLEISNAYELMVMLTNACMFKTALEIAKVFDLSNRFVFECLTKKCGLSNKQKAPNDWRWLIENNLQDLPVNMKSAVDAAWALLEECVNQYEEDKMSTIHKAVASVLIKMNLWLPHWLFSSYQRRNPAELFNLLVTAGRLEEAAEFASDFMLAALGYGKEYFGFTFSMQGTNPAVRLPIDGFINLLHQLECINESNPEKPLLNESERLEGILQRYIETAQKSTIDMCLFKNNLAFNK